MSILICPVCGNPLSETPNQYRCPDGHCFDRAKSGYVNLLLSSGKHTKLPGDNKMMVASRKAFLDKGYYRPLAHALCQAVLPLLPRVGGTLLDAGCGEGYYTQRLAEEAEAAGQQLNITGVDISKFALDKAARRRKDICFAAASVFHLPIATASCHLVTTLFAPWCGEEMIRVLKPGGWLAMVIPGPKHLWELKEAIYDQPYENEVRDYQLEGFAFQQRIPVEEEIFLDNNPDIQSLFQMTPYYYKTSAEGQQRAAALKELTTRIQFEILLYTRNG